MNIENKIVNALRTGRLNIKNKTYKKWYGLDLYITHLVWGRNLRSGASIDVYSNNCHLTTVELDYDKMEIARVLCPLK